MIAPLLLRGQGLIAVDKPAGVPVIPGRGDPSVIPLQQQLERELGQKLWVVHRLDRDTSGVLLFATEAKTHRALSMAFEETGRVHKRYLAICRGAVTAPMDVTIPLAPARRSRMRPARPGEQGAKEAHTRLRPVERFGDRATLVEAEPLTGRTHQIRVHLLASGHPLLFDHQYGKPSPEDAALIQRTPLHAAALTLRGIEGVDDVELVSPLSEDMTRLLDALRSLG